ncbi:hypothetical protein EAH72_03275 [Pseudomonas caspiana]|nr:hypothetical protein EAH72_03275 [Pseudomonas caspiana]
MHGYRVSRYPKKPPGANPVGASLLAMASCHSTSMLNVRPSSRASSLPQGLRLSWAVNPVSLWLAMCL